MADQVFELVTSVKKEIEGLLLKYISLVGCVNRQRFRGHPPESLFCSSLLITREGEEKRYLFRFLKRLPNWRRGKLGVYKEVAFNGLPFRAMLKEVIHGRTI